jgi:hypothetical protein
MGPLSKLVLPCISLYLVCTLLTGCGSSVSTIAASATAAPLKLESLSLVPALDGAPYQTALKASGGSSSYTWAIAAGSLPKGLNLTANTGIISGVPATTGTSNLVVQVTDNVTPTQTATAPLAMTVVSPLVLLTSSVPAGVQGTPYTFSLPVSGGLPAYQWSLVSGNLPTGLSLSSTTGTIAGTPTTSGTFGFAVTVDDSSTVTLPQTVQISLVIAPPPLKIAGAALPGGVVGSVYAGSMQAIGGSAPFRWYLSSGTTPPGLSFGADGSLSGTPKTSGTFVFMASVSDSGTPMQTQSTAVSVAVVVAPPSPASSGSTWYVRTDGGTRYSINVSNGQCDGQGDAAYPGTGVNQHCAFKDVRYLWQDGSYTTTGTQSSFPAYGWIGTGGDTYLIRGSMAGGVSYRVGWNNNASAWDAATSQYWGVQGDPYGSGAPAPLSGTAAQHTRILGENYASCHVASQKTQLHGGFGVSAVLTMSGSSYVDVACLDITDYSSCGKANQSNGCNREVGSLSDYATNGIQWSNTATHDTLTDMHVHGMASSGMMGPTGDGTVMTYLDLLGNASSGWNADNGDGLTGTGSLLVQNFNISWNGCAEQYPATAALPFADCTDDSVGGYGDGFGTATATSNPGWVARFDQGIASYNTQDGLDALHLTGADSSMTITRVLAYGNMGQQIKVGGAAGMAANNLIVTNCNALRQSIPGVPAGFNSRLSDFCRAADAGILMTVGANTTLRFDFNTVYSASATGIDIECDISKGPCGATSKIDFRNNIFLGFLNDSAAGYPAGGTGDYSNPIYIGSTVNPFVNAGSVYANNVTFHAKSNWKCGASGETLAICADPGLVDESWHLYGYGDMSDGLLTTVLQRAGAFVPDVTVDYTGKIRTDPPSIGAYD